MLDITFDGKRVRFATGIKVKKSHWHEKGKVKPDSPNVDAENIHLERIRQQVSEIQAEALLRGLTITETYLKEKFYEKRSGKKSDGFFDYCDRFLASKEAEYKKNTLKGTRSTINHLREFERKRSIPLEFENFSAAFEQELRTYFIREIGLVNNTIAGHIKHLKTILHWCERQGVRIHPDFRLFKVQWEETDQLACTMDELATLMALGDEIGAQLMNVRDLFVLGCCTGLRYSDLSRVISENIHNGMLTIRTEKTKDPLVIPLVEAAQEIHNRNPDGLRHITPQRFNTYLKELCRLAGMTRPVKLSTYSGAEKRERTGEFWKFVASHTMRRTFVTVSKLAGLDDHVVMRVTGHKNVAHFRKYFKQTDATTRAKLEEAWATLTPQGG